MVKEESKNFQLNRLFADVYRTLFVLQEKYIRMISTHKIETTNKDLFGVKLYAVHIDEDLEVRVSDGFIFVSLWGFSGCSKFPQHLLDAPESELERYVANLYRVDLQVKTGDIFQKILTQINQDDNCIKE
jgi:hypothetical protein